MAGRLWLRAHRVVTPAGVLEEGAVLVEGGRIAAVDSAATLRRPADADALEGDLLLPGFIDLHVHGAGGLGFGEGPEAAAEVCRLLARGGVTSCYAGLGAGATLDAVATSVGAAAAVGRETGGARLAGVFLEGPFMSAAKRGAWNLAHLRPPLLPDLDRLIEAGGGAVRRVNVAPELPGAIDFIRGARERGLVVSLGHSDASYEEAVAGIEAGATIANHTFNGMSGLDHRRPGLAAAVLSRDELLAELIMDGVHVHAAAAVALYRARGAGGIALVTDGSLLLGLPDGDYERGGRRLRVAEGACRLADGTLAGSVSPFNRDVRLAVAALGLSLPELAALTSGNAARAMGLAGRGAVAVGRDADLVLLDESLAVEATVVGGRVVYGGVASDQQGPLGN